MIKWFMIKKKLLRSGDVESNPGPIKQVFEFNFEYEVDILYVCEVRLCLDDILKSQKKFARLIGDAEYEIVSCQLDLSVINDLILEKVVLMGQNQYFFLPNCRILGILDHVNNWQYTVADNKFVYFNEVVGVKVEITDDEVKKLLSYVRCQKYTKEQYDNIVSLLLRAKILRDYKTSRGVYSLRKTPDKDKYNRYLSTMLRTCGDSLYDVSLGLTNQVITVDLKVKFKKYNKIKLLFKIRLREKQPFDDKDISWVVFARLFGDDMYLDPMCSALMEYFDWSSNLLT